MNDLWAMYSWLVSHPYLTLLAAWLLLSGVVAVIPQRYHSARWYGWLLWLMHRLSLLTAPEQRGTLQWPIAAKAIVFGAVESAVAVQSKPGESSR